MLGESKVELITIGIILFTLVSIIVFGIKPGSLLKEARNATRINHIGAIRNAIYGYAIDNQGASLPCILDFRNAAVGISDCPEILPYMYDSRLPLEPSKGAQYMVEYVSEKQDRIRVFSTAIEAKGIETTR